MHIIFDVVIAVVIFYLGKRYGSVAIPKIEAEISKINVTASSDAKALAAKIKTLI